MKNNIYSGAHQVLLKPGFVISLHNLNLRLHISAGLHRFVCIAYMQRLFVIGEN